MRPLTFLDEGGNFARINEFHFPSNIPNFIGFGLNLNLVKFSKVIQCPKIHWIWTKPDDTLENVSYRKTNTHMYLESFENLQGFSLFYVSNIYRHDW